MNTINIAFARFQGQNNNPSGAFLYFDLTNWSRESTQFSPTTTTGPRSETINGAVLHILNFSDALEYCTDHIGLYNQIGGPPDYFPTGVKLLTDDPGWESMTLRAQCPAHNIDTSYQCKPPNGTAQFVDMGTWNGASGSLWTFTISQLPKAPKKLRLRLWTQPTGSPLVYPDNGNEIPAESGSQDHIRSTMGGTIWHAIELEAANINIPLDAGTYSIQIKSAGNWKTIAQWVQAEPWIHSGGPVTFTIPIHETTFDETVGDGRDFLLNTIADPGWTETPYPQPLDPETATPSEEAVAQIAAIQDLSAQITALTTAMIGINGTLEATTACICQIATNTTGIGTSLTAIGAALGTIDTKLGTIDTNLGLIKTDLHAFAIDWQRWSDLLWPKREAIRDAMTTDPIHIVCVEGCEVFIKPSICEVTG